MTARNSQPMESAYQQKVHAQKTKQSCSISPQVGKHLLKTKICSLFLNGKCHYGSERCFYAHCVEELREQPNLVKTSLCPEFKRGHCLRDDCKYAHSVEEMSVAAKQVTCLWYRNGHCSHGNGCRYYHGEPVSSKGSDETVLRKDSTLTSAVYSPSTTTTTYSPMVDCASSSFDEFDMGVTQMSSAVSIFDLLSSSLSSEGTINTPPKYEDREFCARCGSAIGCICKVFDECTDLLRLL
jgi:hypothetical protein